MKDSHPATWFYGGIIQTVVWEGASAPATLWGGARITVNHGDTIRLFRTAKFVVPVEVVRA